MSKKFNIDDYDIFPVISMDDICDMYVEYLEEHGNYFGDRENRVEVDVDSETNSELLRRFPNALLMEEIIVTTETDDRGCEDSNDRGNDADKDKNPSNDIIDVMDMLKKIDKTNDSDILNVDTETESDADNVPKCIECGSFELLNDTASGNVVCSDCGVICDTLFSSGPEWRSYSDDKRGGNRCGCSTNYFFPHSTEGTIISGSSNTALKKKQGWNSMIYKEKSLTEVFALITTVCRANGILGMIIDDAKIFYKKISECIHIDGKNQGKQIITRSKNRISIIASCVFKACEENGYPITMSEVARYFGLEKKKMTDGYKQFNDMLQSTDIWDHVNKYNSTDITEHFIRQHCKKLKFSDKHTNLAIKISNNCCRMKLLADHNPKSAAAGAILVMIKYKDLKIDRKKISASFGTSDVTIGKIQNKLQKYIRVLVDDDITTFIIKEFKING